MNKIFIKDKQWKEAKVSIKKDKSFDEVNVSYKSNETSYVAVTTSRFVIDFRKFETGQNLYDFLAKSYPNIFDINDSTNNHLKSPEVSKDWTDGSKCWAYGTAKSSSSNYSISNIGTNSLFVLKFGQMVPKKIISDIYLTTSTCRYAVFTTSSTKITTNIWMGIYSGAQNKIVDGSSLSLKKNSNDTLTSTKIPTTYDKYNIYFENARRNSGGGNYGLGLYLTKLVIEF